MIVEGLKSETWEVVWDTDLDNFIETHLGRRWSCQQNSFYSNGEMVQYEVYPDPKATPVVEAWLASPPVQGVGRTEQPGYGELVKIYTTDILAELCNRGLLPQGELRVHIYW